MSKSRKVISLVALALAALLMSPAQITPPPVAAGGPPSGAAGGALAGTYPNPTIANCVTAGRVWFGGVSAGQCADDTNISIDPATHILNVATSYRLQSSAALTPNGGQLQLGVGFSSVQTPTVTTYNGISTVGTGHPAEYATVDAVTQSAPITATTLYTPTATALFRVSYYAKVTTPGTTSILGGTTGLVLAFTDGTDSVAQTAYTLPEDNQLGAALSVGTGNTTNTTQAVLTGTAVIFAKTGVAITYAFGYSSTGTAMQYELHIKLEQM